MKAFKKTMFFLLVAFAAAGCTTDSGGDDVAVAFNLTDAPVDSEDIANVFVSFTGLQINESGTALEADSTWKDVAIDPTGEYDLLSLTEGTTALLGNIAMNPGTQINQIRFIGPTIEIVESSAPATRLPCELASSTGLKIVKAFQVPLTGNLTLTVDFDVRKSLLVTGGHGGGTTYRMRPVLRAIVEGEAGSITGALPAGYVVYAYKDGTYLDSEAVADPATGVTFGASVTSAGSSDTNQYKLAFLEPGTYDLVVVMLATDTSAEVIDSSTYVDKVVTSRQTTSVPIAAFSF